jgi:SagB-type dehydrogenase family enzyme
MMVRFADGIRIDGLGFDGLIERPGAASLALPGEGARLRTLASLLGTPRFDLTLRAELNRAHPGATSDLVQRLIAEGILVPWGLGPRLADLHLRTTLPSEWELVSPSEEISRALRESSGAGALALPPPALPTGELGRALSQRRTARRFSKKFITIGELATLLAMGVGIGPAEPGAIFPLVLGGPPAGRAYPSGGGLYPVEVLAYPLHVEGVGGGFYYYQVLSHRLLPFSPARSVRSLVELCSHPIDEASVLMFLFVDFARPSLGKYGEKAYRLALLEAGHAAQNALLVAASLGLLGLPICGHRDEELSLAAGLAYPYEAIIYVLALGSSPSPEDESGD